MPTIQIKNVSERVHRQLKSQAANSGVSLQQYMLNLVCRQADIVTIEEKGARKRAEAIAYGEADVDSTMIVQIIREEREARERSLLANWRKQQRN